VEVEDHQLRADDLAAALDDDDPIGIREMGVAIDRDQFTLELMPSSSLPHTPAGRRQAIESMFEVGFISRDQALELMELPDVEAVLSRETARVELPLMQLESIIEDGKIIPPIPYQPLPETLAVAQATFMRAMIEDLPADRLDLLAQFIDAVQELIDDAKRAAMEEAAQLAPAAPAVEAGTGAVEDLQGAALPPEMSAEMSPEMMPPPNGAPAPAP